MTNVRTTRQYIADRAATQYVWEWDGKYVAVLDEQERSVSYRNWVTTLAAKALCPDGHDPLTVFEALRDSPLIEKERV